MKKRKNKQQLWFLFFGRLEQEKGFDLILNMLEFFLEKEIPFKIFIFWIGSLENRLLDIASKSENIHYFWRKSLAEITRYKDNCQYQLMPSTVLETFWLTGLTGCAWGLSIIGFKKWWQDQFILPENDIYTEKWNNDTEKLINKIKKIIDSPLQDPEYSRQIAKRYNTEKWIKQAKALFWEKKRIIIINDYSEKKWGIETYLHDVQSILSKESYEVYIIGKEKIPTTKRGKYRDMITSIWNIKSYFSIKKAIKDLNPEVIWINNLIRYHGRLGMKACKTSHAKKIIMYHDLGHFAPFPSKLREEKEILTPLSPTIFYKTPTTKNSIKKIAGFFKAIRLLPLVKQIQKQINIHLVPSEFMEKIVHKSYTIPKKKIKTLAHFLQE